MQQQWTGSALRLRKCHSIFPRHFSNGLNDLESYEMLSIAHQFKTFQSNGGVQKIKTDLLRFRLSVEVKENQVKQ